MYICSRYSRRKVVHREGCRYVARIAEKSKLSCAEKDTAVAMGYRVCKCCSRVGRQFRREQKKIASFCQTNGMECFLGEEGIVVETPMSRWKIVSDGEPGHFTLFHKNFYSHRKETSGKNANAPEGYHFQSDRFTTIKGILRYILQHDEYRKENPYNNKKMSPYGPKNPRPKKKNIRKQRKYLQKRRKRYEANQTIRLIDSLHTPSYG